MDDAPLEADNELDYNEELELDDSPASMEEGELEDSEPETAAGGRPQSPPEEARRRRAERFGLTPAEQAQEAARRRTLYRSLGLEEPDDGPVRWRAEAVHVRGTETMTTGDVMDYFAKFQPAHVEWVSDDSCNVVWLDERDPVRALLELSSPIAAAAAAPADPDALLVGLDSMNSDSAGAEDAVMKEAGEEEAVDPADIKVPVPPGRWRLGVPHRLAQCLFLRFATRGDKKLPGAEERSRYYKLYGDPSHRGVSGIITERRRRELRGETADEPPPAARKANPWGGIAASWATAEAVGRPGRDFDYDPELNLLRDGGRPPDLRRRLAERAAPAAGRPPAPLPRKRDRSASDADDADSDDEQWRARLKQPRMRMHADDENGRAAARPAAGGDLRARLTGAGGDRWRKNAELTAEERDLATERWRGAAHRRPAPLRLGSGREPDQDDDEDQLAPRLADVDAERPVNIKITRDFSGDELSGGESEPDDESPERPGRRREWADRRRRPDDSDTEEALLDRRTDRHSSADLRARLNSRRAGAKGGRPPLRIEVDNDEYYRVIDSDRD